MLYPHNQYVLMYIAQDKIDQYLHEAEVDHLITAVYPRQSNWLARQTCWVLHHLGQVLMNLGELLAALQTTSSTTSSEARQIGGVAHSQSR